MIYLQTVKIDFADSSQTEAAVRALSAKRHTSLDLQSSQYAPFTDKKFLGFEGKKSLRITRIRAYDRLLPQLILKFDKDAGFAEYKLRYSLLSVLIGFALMLILLNSIYRYVISNLAEPFNWTVVGALLIFVFLTAIEIKLTKNCLKKAVGSFV